MPDMRFAPAPALLAQTGSGGLNQTNLRSHNERLILDLLRRGGTLTRFEIGQTSGLSAQTISVLVRALLREGLLIEGEAHRGRVGPPTTPFSLNPEGAFAIGVYAGHQVIDLCCLDFIGTLRQCRRVEIDTSRAIEDALGEACADFLAELDDSIRSRCIGIGVGLSGSPGREDAAETIEGRLVGLTNLPCFILDDATSAATGEMLFGDRSHPDSFAFAHVGMTTTLRVVLNGQAQSPMRNGVLPLMGLDGLSDALRKQGHDTTSLYMTGQLPSGAADVAEEWISVVATDLKASMLRLLAVLDLPLLVVVGPLESLLLQRIADTFADIIAGLGIPISTAIGHNAQFAKASGAAAFVLATRFSQNRG